MDRLLITTSSFGAGGGKIYEYLESKGFEVVLNPFSRKITEKELLSVRFTWMASKETDIFNSRPTTFIELAGTLGKNSFRKIPDCSKDTC